MTIDHMTARLEVTSPTSSEGAGTSAGGGPMSTAPASPQGTRELKEFLRPIVNEIVAEELRMHLRTQGR